MKRDHNTSFLKQYNGRTSVETMATLLLLILLGVGLFSVTLSAVGAYQRLYMAKEKTSELRVASSYIIMKIRQNDMTGCLKVTGNPITGKNALVVYEEIEGMSYATWIFCYEGMLKEALVLKEEVPTLNASQNIAKIDNFQVSYDQEEQMIFASVGKIGEQTYDNIIKIRSEMGEQH